ncbi:MAG: beta-galactosidase [Verrucomicrobia bacterium]|nr:beta-galactosidase [Verrucomicrobiota bacterium]
MKVLRHCRLVFFLLTILPIIPVAGAEFPTASLKQDANTLFLAHLDGPEADADFANGVPTGEVKGTLEFDEGCFGKAVKLMGAEIHYQRVENIDLNQGTIEMRLMDLDIDHAHWGGQWRPLFFCGNSKGSKQYYFQALLINNLFYFRILTVDRDQQVEVNLQAVGEAGPLPVGKWIYCACAWDLEKGDIWLQVNGKVVATQRFKPTDLKELKEMLEAFPPAEIVIGGTAAVLMDELRISSVVRKELFESSSAMPTAINLSAAGDSPTSDDFPSRQVITPHIPWARPYHKGTTRILVLENRRCLREVIELAQRADIEFDVVPLTTDGDVRDQYGTMAPHERTAIQEKLKNKPEALVLGGISSKWFPDDLWKTIIDQVATGMGLVWPGLDVTEPRMGDLFKNRADLTGFLSNGPPITMMGLFGSELKAVLPAATYGQGRVIGLNYANHTARRYAALIPCYYLGDEEYHFAELARMVVWAARKDSQVSVTAKGDANSLPAAQAGHVIEAAIISAVAKPVPARVDFVVRETSVAWRQFESGKYGRVLQPVEVGHFSYPELFRTSQKLTITNGNNQIAFKMPALPQGDYSTDVHVYDAQNRVIDWDSAFVRCVASPTIISLKFDKDSYQNGETAIATLTVAGNTKEVRLDWELRDADQRLIGRGSEPVQATTTVCAPIRNALTRALWLNVKLMCGETLLQHVKDCFLVRIHRTRDFHYLLYGGIPWLDPQLGYTGQVAVVPGLSNAEMLAQQDMDIFYWLTVPGFNSHAPFQVKVRKPCFTDPAFRKEVDWYFEGLGAAARREEPVAALAADEWEYMDYRWATPPAPDLCRSPTCLAGFRDFLKKSYGTISALNKEWGTSHSDWNQIHPILAEEAGKQSNKAPLVDLWRYNEWKVADFLRYVEQSYRKQYPDARIGLSGTPPARGYNGYDYWRIMNASHAIVNYSGVMPRESMSFQTPRHFASSWFGYTGNFLETVGFRVWESLFHHYDAFTNYAYFPNYGPYWPDFRIAPGAAAMRDAYQETQTGISTLLKGAQRQLDGIAVHYSQTSVHIASLGLVRGLTIEKFNDNLTSIENLIVNLGCQFRSLAYEEIEQGALVKEKFRVLILPLSTALSDKEVEQIKGFVRNGGLVVADAVPGIFDEHGKQRERGALDELFGVSRDNPALDANIGSLVCDSGFKVPVTESSGATAMRGESGVMVGDGKALGTFEGNVPALVLKPNGAGKALFANVLFADYNLFRAGGVGGEVGTITRAKAARCANSQATLRGIFDLAALKPAVTIKNSTPAEKARINTEIVRYLDGPSQYVAIFPDFMGSEKLKDRVSNQVVVQFPQPSHLYDVRARAYLGQTDAIRTALVEGEPVIYAMQSSKLDRLTIALDKPTCAQGDMLTAKLGVIGAPPGRRVYHVEALDPGGKPVRVHTLNLDAPTGTARFAIPLALDAAPGVWKLCARDVASGVAAEAPFTVAP